MSGRGFLIAAPQSGSGKTTVSLAIMAALARRGLTVAPFKCGPDFIDPGYHRLITGRASINLDAWMCPESFVRETFCHHAAAADVALLEGAMGLFDGLGSSAMEGSSAQIAAITGAPVVLVVNARGMAASAAPLVKGFAGFHPNVRIAGVIFNNIGSAAHGALLREALAAHCPEVACYGCIPRDETLLIPSRHLGLVTAEDNPLPPEFVVRLAEMAERCLDLEGLAGLSISLGGFAPCPHPHPRPLLEGEGVVTMVSGAQYSEQTEVSQTPSPSRGGIGWGWCGSPARIAVASDAAFCFCYEDNLRLLREAGARIVPFSPLADAGLPADIDGLYLPGGYPELYAEQLAANQGMLEAIRQAVADDLPVYAECGGFIYLTEGVERGLAGEGGNFTGIFPVRARMLAARKALGYRQVAVAVDCPVGAAGSVMRGHEFHYSEIPAMPQEIARCYRLSRRGEELGREGYGIRNVLASYVHLHFGSNPAIAATFVQACKNRRAMLEN